MKDVYPELLRIIVPVSVHLPENARRSQTMAAHPGHERGMCFSQSIIGTLMCGGGGATCGHFAIDNFAQTAKTARHLNSTFHFHFPASKLAINDYVLPRLLDPASAHRRIYRRERAFNLFCQCRRVRLHR